jgi:hypothetical protein
VGEQVSELRDSSCKACARWTPNPHEIIGSALLQEFYSEFSQLFSGVLK